MKQRHLTSYILHLTFYILHLTCLAIGLASCSTQKNTGASRAWHELKVMHNVQLNGEIAYNEGIQAINQAHADNFSTFLPLYPVSDHQAAESSASSMDKAIEKCRKSIKLHSIKARPQINPKKRNNQKYQNWLKNKEFNNQMYRAWFMLGKSEFHKGDFLGSIGTFQYIERLYENDPNMVAMCQLWVARAYGELGWIYEAEDILSKVKVDDLSRQNEPFYSAVSADILLKGQRYREAIPFVRVAKQDEKRKEYLPRFEYVLGQLYQSTRQYPEARMAYQRVYQLHPKDVSMEFNARIRYAELKGDTLKSIKQLRQMAKLYKYRDHLDQLYGTIGNIYLNNGDTIQALAAYNLGIASSTQNGNEKGEVLVRAGDLYFDRFEYPEASPCYHEAAQILTNEHPDYARVSHRSEVLDEVVVEIQTVELQDSLQRLGHMTREEQIAIVEQIIADLKEKERLDSIAQAQQQREQELEEQRGGPLSVDLSKMVGNRTGEAANWYFYNPQLMRSGKQDFMQKWGNRALEDNWRRLSKASMIGGAMSTPDDILSDTTKLSSDTTALLSGDSLMNSSSPLDVYNVQYYLQQIPQTENDFAASDALIADALYNLIFLYRDRMNNQSLSDRTFAEFLSRFPNDERIVDLYYDRYLNALRLHLDDEASLCRQEIMNRFPESAQARIVSNPQYFASLQKMAVQQDSLYAVTYDAYRHSQFKTVQQNTEYAESSFPLTPLMPRFLFLNAVATAKTDGQEAFTTALRDLVQRYPENELSAMAKDMLAMMGQGMEAQQGGSLSSLNDQRQVTVAQESADTSSLSFSAERNEKSLVYVVIPQNEDSLNALLYQVALFNFSQFLIKDFDLRKVAVFTLTQSALEIAGFESMTEAEWYISLIVDQADLQLLFHQLNAQIVPITESNLKLLNHPYTLEDYIKFLHP